MMVIFIILVVLIIHIKNHNQHDFMVLLQHDYFKLVHNQYVHHIYQQEYIQLFFLIVVQEHNLSHV